MNYPRKQKTNRGSASTSNADHHVDTPRWSLWKMDAAICAALVLITLIPYAQTCSFGFVNIDDPGYVYENALLKNGLSLTSVLEATFGFHQANWHPLVWISYMLEVEITVKVAEKSGISPQSSRLLLDSRQKECSSPSRRY